MPFLLHKLYYLYLFLVFIYFMVLKYISLDDLLALNCAFEGGREGQNLW
jgi:hypothetical protein